MVFNSWNYSGVFQGLPEPTKTTAPRHLLSLYGIIYVTWYTSDLPEATGVRLRLPNSHALLGSGRPCKTPLIFTEVIVDCKSTVILLCQLIQNPYNYYGLIISINFIPHHTVRTQPLQKISTTSITNSAVRWHWVKLVENHQLNYYNTQPSITNVIYYKVNKHRFIQNKQSKNFDESKQCIAV